MKQDQYEGAGEMPSRKVVIVLGMSRSGTSLLTRGINVLGVELGENLIQSTKANPKGHWENNDIFGINEQLLELIGSSWHNVALTCEIDFFSHCFDSVRGVARAVINKLISQCPICGFKDPRICRLLPFWQDLLNECDVEVYYIVCLRNPVDVALSLERRNNFGMRKSLLLWLAHMYCIAKFINNDQSIIIRYEELLKGPHDQLNRIVDFLDIDISDKHKSIHEYCNHFLERALCHHHSTLNELRSASNFQQIISYYNHFISLSSQNHVTKKDWLELSRDLNGLELVWDFFHEISEGEIRKLKAAPLTQYNLEIDQTHPFSNSLDESRKIAEPLILFVDYPEKTSPVPVFRKLAVSGWALSLSGVAHVQVLQPDGKLVYLDYGLARKDVQTLHPVYPHADLSGFSGCLNLSGVESGRYELVVRVTSRSGEVKESYIPFIKN